VTAGLWLLAASLLHPGPTRPDSVLITRNVILVTIDGFRWQELFSGADSVLLAAIPDSVTRAGAVQAFWRPDASARRQALLPFFWGTVARDGQLLGNRFDGGAVRVTNGLRFSYPGYQEILAGFPDSRISSNDPVPNPNVTVLEWLNGQPGMGGRVAAFGSWGAFTAIINAGRSGLPVNAGWQLVEDGSPVAALLNRVQAFSTRTWDEERDDALTYLAAHDYLVRHQPRLLYVALGDTDEWAHVGRYVTYLDMAHRTDAMLRELWETVQSLPAYRGRTSLVLVTDHGRGDGARWTDHGRDVPEAEFIWVGVLGPDTPARGARTDLKDATQAQVAATVAALLGYDYAAAVPRAGPPLPGVIR
jgi:hypothetical protein